MIPVPSLDPVTWNLTNKSYTESGSFSASATNVFVSTDGTNSKLTYVAGSSCKIDKSQMKMGGATQYGTTPNRYFILPSISGSGTLSVEFGDNANTVKVVTTVEKNAAAIASLDGDDPKVELSGLDASTTYYLLMDTKSYFKSITWTPDAPAVTLGDVNNDGSVTMADANAVVNYYLADGKGVASGFNIKAADVNNDDQITMADANAIVNMYLAGEQ